MQQNSSQVAVTIRQRGQLMVVRKVCGSAMPPTLEESWLDHEQAATYATWTCSCFRFLYGYM